MCSSRTHLFVLGEQRREPSCVIISYIAQSVPMQQKIMPEAQYQEIVLVDILV